jgi:hypothetical protein
MPTENRNEGPAYVAQDAALATAGKPKSLTGPGRRAKAAAEPAPPTPEELDAREDRVGRRRRPMGPTQDQVPETVPQELGEPVEPAEPPGPAASGGPTRPAEPGWTERPLPEVTG